ncbi:4890_t:CDS:1, partial [Ambispora gerdemannii]
KDLPKTLATIIYNSVAFRNELIGLVSAMKAISEGYKLFIEIFNNDDSKDLAITEYRRSIERS